MQITDGRFISISLANSPTEMLASLNFSLGFHAMLDSIAQIVVSEGRKLVEYSNE